MEQISRQREPSGEQPAGGDRLTRQAALWASLVAVPLAVAVGVVAFFALRDVGEPTAAPSATASAVRPQSTAAVTVSAAPLSERAATVCRALVSSLPSRIGDLPQRPVTAGAEQNAAYGDPAVTMACGVPAVPVAPTETLYVLDGVCWNVGTRAGASVWTTVDREVPVEVTVPEPYGTPGQVTIGFSAPIAESVPSAQQIPSGCQG